MEIRENVILAPYTTFRIGGPAKYFCEVIGVDELREALNFSKENNLKFFILGEGSNILVSDQGFDGLVIKMDIKGLEFQDGDDCVTLSAGAGENWDFIVGQAVEKGLSGIENLSLIPGTVGAAVYQNIGAYGAELKDVLEKVDLLDANSGVVKTFSNKECRFGYRDSVFKHKEGENLIVVNAYFKLSKGQDTKINYPDLIKFFEGKKPSISDIRSAVIEIRKRKLPYPDEVGNAGSFFKNPVVTGGHFEKIILNHSDLKGFRLSSGSVKLSAAQLIEKCGWKGKVYGNVGVSEKHSLVLVNHGEGSAKEVVDISEQIKTSIKNKFGVDLEPEVQTI